MALPRHASVPCLACAHAPRLRARQANRLPVSVRCAATNDVDSVYACTLPVPRTEDPVYACLLPEPAPPPGARSLSPVARAVESVACRTLLAVRPRARLTARPRGCRLRGSPTVAVLEAQNACSSCIAATAYAAERRCRAAGLAAIESTLGGAGGVALSAVAHLSLRTEFLCLRIPLLWRRQGCASYQRRTARPSWRSCAATCKPPRACPTVFASPLSAVLTVRRAAAARCARTPRNGPHRSAFRLLLPWEAR